MKVVCKLILCEVFSSNKRSSKVSFVWRTGKPSRLEALPTANIQTSVKDRSISNKPVIQRIPFLLLQSQGKMDQQPPRYHLVLCSQQLAKKAAERSNQREDHRFILGFHLNRNSLHATIRYCVPSSWQKKLPNDPTRGRIAASY